MRGNGQITSVTAGYVVGGVGGGGEIVREDLDRWDTWRQGRKNCVQVKGNVRPFSKKMELGLVSAPTDLVNPENSKRNG